MTILGSLVPVFICVGLALSATAPRNIQQHSSDIDQLSPIQQRRFMFDTSADGACSVGDIRPKNGTICRAFEKCVTTGWYPDSISCPSGLLWNTDILACDYANNVNINTCTTNHHLSNQGSSLTTQSTFVPRHGYKCGDGQCFNGHCSSHNHRCSCYHGYVGMSCNQQSVTQGYESTTRAQTTQPTHVPQHNTTCGHSHCFHGKCTAVTTHCDLHKPCSTESRCVCTSGYVGDICRKQLVTGSHCSNINLFCQYGDCAYDTFDSRYSCYCTSGYTGQECELYLGTAQTTTTTHPQSTTAITTTTTIATTTTMTATSTLRAAIANQYTCQSSTTISDLANHVTSQSMMSSSCGHSDYAGSEAFVLNHCDVKRPATWSQGVNVMALCNGLHRRAPIATFSHGVFRPGTDIAAIFLGCLGEQVMVGLQTCGGVARIEHFSKGGPDYRNTDHFFVVQ